MYVIKDDSTMDEVRLITGTLNGKGFSLVFEDGVWREQIGNFDINDSDFKDLMNIIVSG